MEEIFSFGDWIKRRRKALDLTQEQLADCVSYSVAMIRKIEADGQRPSTPQAERLADCLRLAPDERDTFVRVARGVLRVNRLPPPNLDVLAPVQRPAAGPALRPPCPYPGMRPFNEDLRELFFGRDTEVQDALTQLHLYPFLALIGPSGSGKSSLVFAGLFPALRRSMLFGPGEWLIRVMRPGARPLETLADTLETTPAAIEQAVPNLLAQSPDAQRFLLVVDQFEELFTLAQDCAQAFQHTLLQLADVPHCAIVITARADFYPDLMVSPLWRTIQRHRLEVAPLDTDGLRESIVQPARAVGVLVEPALIERLVADASGEPGVLPLLQETLRLLWDHLEQCQLPLSAYESLVLPHSAYTTLDQRERTGLHFAIVRCADAALAALPDEQQDRVRRVFLRLVQFGEGRADTRRQQPISALLSAGEDLEVLHQILNHLTSHRLLTRSGSATAGDAMVDIAHEALLIAWPTLVGWVSERRQAEQTRRWWDLRAAEWLARVQRGQNGGLLDAAELADIEHWLASPDAADVGHSAALIELVQQSRAALETVAQAQAAEQQRVQAQARALRHSRVVMIAIGSIIGLGLLGLLGMAGSRELIRHQVDQEAMMVTIPAGKALIGSDNHTEHFRAFRIDKYEVNNRQYQACVTAGVCKDILQFVDLFTAADRTERPVVGVTPRQAQDYCGWRGRRLPTADEWERAARGTEGRLWPPSNGPLQPGQVRMADDNRYDDTVDVKAMPESATPADEEQIFHLVGNVEELVVPAATGAEEKYLLVGGSFRRQIEHVTDRWDAGTEYVDRAAGFRCASD